MASEDKNTMIVKTLFIEFIFSNTQFSLCHNDKTCTYVMTYVLLLFLFSKFMEQNWNHLSAPASSPDMISVSENKITAQDHEQRTDG